MHDAPCSIFVFHLLAPSHHLLCGGIGNELTVRMHDLAESDFCVLFLCLSNGSLGEQRWAHSQKIQKSTAQCPVLLPAHGIRSMVDC